MVLKNVSGWTTRWTIQNVTAAWASGVTHVYGPSGQRAAEIAFTLPPFGSATFSPADLPTLSGGFVGSAVVSSTQPVASVVLADRPDGDRFAYEGATSGNAVVALPLVFNRANGWSSGIQVQNLASTAASVQLFFAANPDAGQPEPVTIPPLASRTLYLPSLAGLAQGYVGSVAVQALGGEPIAAVVNSVRSDGSAMAYTGASAVADRLEAPLIMKRYHGWSTGLQVLNAASGPGSLAVQYRGSGPTRAGAGENLAISGAGSVTLYTPAQPSLPDGFAGSATVLGSPGTRLIGTVSGVKDPGAATAYVAGVPPISQAAVPLVMKDDEGWTASIQVKNANAAPTGLIVSFYDEEGVPVARLEDTLGPGAARTFYLPAIADLPSGFTGSAVVQATSPGSPGLSVVVNQTGR
jgi:hypothetical protein